jgi:hypothetical protein
LRLRLIAAGILFAVAVGFASLPFHASIPGFKGVGGHTLSCRAPIIEGWHGGSPARRLPGGASTYDSSQQCGHDARVRLVISGIVAASILVGVGVTLWRGRRHRYPLGATSF